MMVKAPRRFICALALVSALMPAGATTFHVDPVEGRSQADGSAQHPWRSVQEVIDNRLVSPGDTLLLHDGYHGDISIRSRYNAQYITVAAAPGASARLRRILISSGSRWRFHGLSLSPSFASSFERVPMVLMRDDAREVVFESCTLRTRVDCDDWSASDWDRLSCDGFVLDGGAAHVLRGNVVENINFGMSVAADSCLVEHNVINGFAGDGIRALGDYCTYQYNLIKNSKDVNGNHDDGIQSYSIGRNGVGTSTVRGVIIRGNLIINYESRTQSHRGSMQGIGCFDGMFADWLIEHNVVIADSWHGITLRGALRCTIRNNTVCAPDRADIDRPWIKLQNHKNGTPSSECEVSQNLATAFSVSSSQGQVKDNIEIRDPHNWVVNFDTFDMRIREHSEARGGASDGSDIGAYLFVGSDTDAVPVAAPPADGMSLSPRKAPRSQPGASETALFDLRGRWAEIAAGRRANSTGIFVVKEARNRGKPTLVTPTR